MTGPGFRASPTEGPLPSPPVYVRGFEWDDLPRVMAVWQAAGAGVHLGSSDTPEAIRRKWTHDPDLFLVAESDREIVGAVMAGFDGRRAIVYHLAVVKGRRLQGIGRRLMDELDTRLRARGCIKAYLLATPENQPAVDFYRNLGWDVMDMVLMGKELG